MKKRMLSIVIPCYNEGTKIYKNLLKVQSYMDELVVSPEFSKVIDDYEIIAVNDGSKDNTASEILLAKFDKIIPVINDVNRGKGHCIRQGFGQADGEFVLFMDADLSVDLIAINKALAILGTDAYSCVIGSRKNRLTFVEGDTKWYREILS